MPKINVYLPDELAEAVKETGIPVSAICQRALEQAVRRITAIRQTALGTLAPADLAERFPQFTGRARTVLALAIEQAPSTVGSGHLLAGMIAEGTNLALHVLGAIEIDPAQVRRELDRQIEATEPGDGTFSNAAAAALELTITEATSLGHNYVGCEHLLLGLIAEPDGVAGQVLRGLGAEARLTRRAVVAALAGYVHLRAGYVNMGAAQAPAAQLPADPAEALATALRPLIARIERLESRLDPAGQ